MIPWERPRSTALLEANKPWYLGATDSLTLSFGVDNLFDRRYAQHSTVQVVQVNTTATAVVGRTYATPEAGRNLKLALDWCF